MFFFFYKMSLKEKINDLSLSTMNKYAFYLHWFSGLIIAGILFGVTGEISFNTTLYGYDIDTISADGKDLTFNYTEKLVLDSTTLKLIIVFIFLITALFHYFYWKSQFYRREVASGKNRIRWVEYAVTASLMIFIYCVISGVKDVYSVFLIVLFNIVLMSFGYFLEMSDGKNPKLVAIIMGFFILSIIFSFSYYQFYGNIEAAKETFDIPDFVYAVVIAMVFWWISFGVVGILYYKSYLKGERNFLRYEKYYIFLSFVSKAFMGYYLTFGLTRDAPDTK